MKKDIERIIQQKIHIFIVLSILEGYEEIDGKWIYPYQKKLKSHFKPK